ncbi:MAG: hypothetical protein D6730_12460 [Bacteroidetes bacterium]|nr:MAG: hypothetical protein D6730_12460 [Bacteroidota bacterium]
MMKPFVQRCGLMLLMMALLAACSNTQKSTRSAQAEDPSVEVAYGKKKKSEVTEAVATVETKDPTISLANYLRRVPGVRVLGNGPDARIIVRGGTSVNQSEAPLFVVDGAPVGNDFSQVYNMLDVNDIKRVTVLKDGSSTAMYGTRGNGGVILIHTKSGRDK